MKIFVSDLDGTLIDNALKNNDAVLDCVHRIKSSGNEFVIATGRTLYGTEVLDFFEQPFYVIVMNGAIILDKNKKVIFKQPIGSEILNSIINEFSNENVEYITQDKTYVSFTREEYIKRYSKWDFWYKKMIVNRSQEDFEYMLSHFVFNADINQIKDEIVKVNILELDKEKYNEKDKYIAQFEQLHNNSFSPCMLEITAKGVTKKEAVLKLMSINNWKADEIYAFGNGDNDSDMLAYFQHSFAPSNASEKAKKVLNI